MQKIYVRHARATFEPKPRVDETDGNGLAQVVIAIGTLVTVSSSGYSGGESDSLSGSSGIVSLLDRLKAPVPSELAKY